MKLITFLISIHFVYSELHTLNTTYTEIRGQTFEGIPDLSAVTTLDGQQIDYYERDIKNLIPRQDWMKKFASGYRFKEYIDIRERVQQINKINIHFLMEQFNHLHGVHIYQRMYGCDWDIKTGESNVFDQHAYDGEDFIRLDMKEFRYITAVEQGRSTVMKWNNDREQFKKLQQYYENMCVYWLKEFLHLPKDTFERTEHPEVSLLQKTPDHYVLCHVTGFHLRETTILWRKNGQDINTDLMIGDLLPNEDGTFQRTLTLYAQPDDWKKDQYICVVEHMGNTIQKILTTDEIKRNIKSVAASPAPYIIYLVCSIIVVVFGLIGLICWRRLKASNKKVCPSSTGVLEQKSAGKFFRWNKIQTI